ncbi:aminoglycoside N(3)-acetyltransferase [Streptomyces aquilus]|uniref:AAC(3) family N-acetyltransferase n=1 Tax=Streptomyces aquilus TaxID=2548456 RepID=A0A3Q9C1T0_9ACTN|nr:AAC(3) family N-acetyltransferase [Streptomyces aquilus]AZP21525.1 AAC(3) family N-acetyltransferase [Streptomyces aquilus]
MTDDRSLVEGLERLGVRPGATLLVHASLRRLGTAPDAVLAALLDALGPEGTVVVPTFTAGNSDTSRAYREATRHMTRRQRHAYLAEMPAFDPAVTPSEDMGRLAETVRCAQGAVRSGHPQTSFAALGARAAELVAGHDETCHLGPRSPLGRLYDTRAQVLFLGVGYESCSAFHLAEYRVDGAPRKEYRCVVLRDGARHWMAYKDVDLDDEDFGALGEAFEARHAPGAGSVVCRGQVGYADARLFPVREAVDFAVTWLAGNRPLGIHTDPSQNAARFLH